LPVIDENLSQNQSHGAYGGLIGIAQSFTGNGTALKYATFYLTRVGTAPGNLTAVLYAHSGTFGTSSLPSGAALATSDPIAASSISTTPGEVRFTFSSPYTVAAGTHYVICLLFSQSGMDVNNCIFFYSNSVAATHPGNSSVKYDIWYLGDNPIPDMYFITASELITNTISLPAIMFHRRTQGMS
jgi:hypothetical protein